MEKKKTTSRIATKQQATLISFLLDRTGSMASCLEETIRGFNSYVEKMREEGDKSMQFRLTQFDSESIDVVQESVPMKDVLTLNHENFKPRSWTPLYDAIGKTIRATEKVAGNCKVLFVTLTDGRENCSKEWNDETIQKEIRRKENDDKWTFAYVGVGPQGWAAVRAVAVGTQGFSNVIGTNTANVTTAYSHMAKATRSFASRAGGQCAGNLFAGMKNLMEEDEEKTTTGKTK